MHKTNYSNIVLVKVAPLMWDDQNTSSGVLDTIFWNKAKQVLDSRIINPWMIIFNHNSRYDTFTFRPDTNQMLHTSYFSYRHCFSHPTVILVKSSKGWVPYTVGVQMIRNDAGSVNGCGEFIVYEFPKNIYVPFDGNNVNKNYSYGVYGNPYGIGGYYCNYYDRFVIDTHLFGYSLFASPTHPATDPNKTSTYYPNRTRYTCANERINGGAFYYNTDLSGNLNSSYYVWQYNTGRKTGNSFNISWDTAGLYNRWNGNRSAMYYPTDYGHQQSIYFLCCDTGNHINWPNTLANSGLQKFGPKTLPLNDKWEVKWGPKVNLT